MFQFAALIFLATTAAAQSAGSAGLIRIMMERKGSGMDLSSPQYKLTLNGDGSVVFEGKRNVSAMGVHRRNIEPKTVEELTRRFEEIHYFDLPSHAGGSCTDAALVVTSLTIGNQNHEVSNWECGSTASLTELEDDIDRETNSKIWIRGHLRLWLHWPWFHSQF